MKTYSPELIAEKKKDSVQTFWLVKLGTYCFTDCDQDITYGGDTYQSWTMKLSGFSASDTNPLDGGQIDLANVELDLSSMVLNHLLKDADAYVYEAWYQADMTLIEVDLVFYGKVDGRPGLDEEWAQVKVSAHKNPFTARLQRTRITRTRFPYMPVRGTKFVWGSSLLTVK